MPSTLNILIIGPGYIENDRLFLRLSVAENEPQFTLKSREDSGSYDAKLDLTYSVTRLNPSMYLRGEPLDTFMDNADVIVCAFEEEVVTAQGLKNGLAVLEERYLPALHTKGQLHKAFVLLCQKDSDCLKVQNKTQKYELDIHTLKVSDESPALRENILASLLALHKENMSAKTEALKAKDKAMLKKEGEAFKRYRTTRGDFQSPALRSPSSPDLKEEQILPGFFKLPSEKDVGELKDKPAQALKEGEVDNYDYFWQGNTIKDKMISLLNNYANSILHLGRHHKVEVAQVVKALQDEHSPQTPVGAFNTLAEIEKIQGGSLDRRLNYLREKLVTEGNVKEASLKDSQHKVPDTPQSGYWPFS